MTYFNCFRIGGSSWTSFVVFNICFNYSFVECDIFREIHIFHWKQFSLKLFVFPKNFFTIRKLSFIGKHLKFKYSTVVVQIELKQMVVRVLTWYESVKRWCWWWLLWRWRWNLALLFAQYTLISERAFHFVFSAAHTWATICTWLAAIRWTGNYIRYWDANEIIKYWCFISMEIVLSKLIGLISNFQEKLTILNKLSST